MQTLDLADIAINLNAKHQACLSPHNESYAFRFPLAPEMLSVMLCCSVQNLAHYSSSPLNETNIL